MKVDPPPPFDPECADALGALPEWISRRVTAETIGARRAAEREVPLPDDDVLRRGGRFAVEEPSVPGPPGAPSMSILICIPTSAGAPVAAVCHLHGGG